MRALVGHVGDRPQHHGAELALAGRARCTGGARCADAGAPIAGVAHLDLLAAGLAPVRGARQAKERGGGIGIAGEGGVEAPVLAGLRHADEIPEAAVGVDDRAVLARHEHAVLEAVGERLDEIVVAHALADADVAGEKPKMRKAPSMASDASSVSSSGSAAPLAMSASTTAPASAAIRTSGIAPLSPAPGASA